MNLISKAALISFLCGSAAAFSVDVSRRQAIQAAFTGAATLAAPGLVFPANAAVSEETPRVVTRMGGLLVSFSEFHFIPSR